MKSKSNFMERIGFRLFKRNVREVVKINETIKVFFTDDEVILRTSSGGDISYLPIEKTDARRLAREIARVLGPGPGWSLSERSAGRRE